MKKFIPLFFVFLSQKAFSQAVGIGTATPNSSAQLDISSTAKGLLIPRMTTAQRSAILSPANGLMVYDISTNSFWYYNGGSWNNLSGGGGSFSLPYSNSVNTSTPSFSITNAGAMPAIEGITSNDFGVGISGKTNAPFAWGVSAFARSPFASALYASADSATAVNASSVHGVAVDATSTNNVAIRASTSNGLPAIIASNSHATGIAIQATASNNIAIKGISNGTGSGKIGVWGDATGNGNTGVYGSSGSAAGYGVYGNNSTGIAVYGFTNNGTGVNAFAGTGTALKAVSSTGYALDVNGNIKIAGGNTSPVAGAVLTSDAQGNATWQSNKVAFKISGRNPAYSGISQMLYTILMFDDENYDYSNSLNTYPPTVSQVGRTVFVAPKNGLYHFDTQVMLGSGAGIVNYYSIDIIVKRSGVETNIASVEVDDPAIPFHGSGLSVDAKILAGDEVYVRVYQMNSSPATLPWGNVPPQSYFSGHLVFAD